MAEIRRLLSPAQKKLERQGLLPADAKPKGKWQATVRHPSMKRWSKSDALRTVVKAWADDQEAAMRRGEFVDPNAGKVTLTAWRTKWLETRRVEIATSDKNDSWWRNHIEPEFGTWPLASIQSWDVEAWVTKMEKRGVGAETARSSLRHLRLILEDAVKHRLLMSNPAKGVKADAPPPHIDRTLTLAESDGLLEQFKGSDRLFVELLLYCGLRFQEAAGLRRFRVDLLRKRIQIAKVKPRKGAEKRPKTDAGVRLVPVPADLVLGLSKIIPAPDDELVFTSPEGQPIRYDNWLRRVWYPALRRAKLADPQPTPHDLRHTYGTWLGEKGVPASQIAALMGHATLRSVERYIHATDARFAQALAALQRAPKPLADRRKRKGRAAAERQGR